MSLLRIFAALLVAFTFTFVGCNKDTGNTSGDDANNTEQGTPDTTDEDLDDGSGAPAQQPDDAEADDAEGGDDAAGDDAAGDDAPADAEEKGADAPAKKDGE